MPRGVHASHPIDIFIAWLDEAVRHEIDVPDAMQIATLSSDLRPAVRTVLVKAWSRDGLDFYTNLASRKAAELAQHPKIAAVLHWKSLKRQVIIEGEVHPLDSATCDAYWATRPRASQLAAWASRQSDVLDTWDTLMKRLDATTQRFDDTVPRPDFWGGYRLVPDRWEFWQNRPNRLHERTEYRRCADDTWERQLLYP